MTPTSNQRDLRFRRGPTTTPIPSTANRVPLVAPAETAGISRQEEATGRSEWDRLSGLVGLGSQRKVTNRTVGNGRALGPGPRSWSGRVPRLGKAQGPALSTALGSPSTTQVGSNRREILPRNNLPDTAIACDLGPFCCRGLNRDATGRIVGPSCANHRRRQSSQVAQLWRYSQW